MNKLFSNNVIVFIGSIRKKMEEVYTYITRNTLTQASKNGRKPHLFPQKKFVRVFYAINIFNTIYYFKTTNFNCA